MQNYINARIEKVAKTLSMVIEAEIPDNKNDMKQFIANLNERFPKSPRGVRATFEIVYEKKFGEKFVW